MLIVEKDIQDLRLWEQAIIKESFGQKNKRIKDLESEVQYLRSLINGHIKRLEPDANPPLQERMKKHHPRTISGPLVIDRI